MWNVGCTPVATATALLMRGCAGSFITGPGPEGGARNSAPCAIHPTAPEGAKSGTAAVCAAHDGADIAEVRRVATPSAQYRAMTVHPSVRRRIIAPNRGLRN